MDYGATRAVECWGDDVPVGTQIDFQRAVQAKDDETVVFSWIQWPDKATRDAGMEKMMEDPCMNPKTNPMPFDGKRMIFGGLMPIVERGGKSWANSPTLGQQMRPGRSADCLRPCADPANPGLPRRWM